MNQFNPAEHEVVRVPRVIKLDSAKHPDFHGYAICELYYTKQGKFLFHTDPIELFKLDYKDLSNYILNILPNALTKGVIKETALLSNFTYSLSGV